MKSKIIHQCWFEKDSMPERVLDAVQTVKTLNPDFEYRFWTDKDIEELELQVEYKRASHPAFFSDVARLKILEKHGEIYIDVDTICLKPLNNWYQKYQDHPLYISEFGNMPADGVIIAAPGLDCIPVYVDYKLDEPVAFNLQRLDYKLIPQEEVGREGNILKDIVFNSWVKVYEDSLCVQ